MPRYFFNVVHSGHLHRDGIGQEFSTEGAALEEARLVAGELLRDAAFASRSLDHVLEVSDREGNVVITFRCSDPKIVAGPSGGARTEHDGD
jgi:hypothetical protein